MNRTILLSILVLVITMCSNINSLFAQQHDYLAPVKQNDRWGYIDQQNNFVIYPKFSFANDFSENLAAVEINNKWGYIDGNGKYVIEPQFDDAYNFIRGLARVKSNGKWGFINPKGTYEIAAQFENANDFSGGVALVMVNGLYGYVDASGTMVFEPQFEDAYDFTEGMALVSDDGKWKYLNTSQKLVSLPRCQEVSSFFSEGLVIVQGTNGDYGFVNHKGKYEIVPQFQDALPFSEGLAAVHINDAYAYVNLKGKINIDSKFQDADIFSEGKAAVQYDNLYGYIKNDGEWFISPQYEAAEPFNNQLAKVQKDGNYGYINAKGNFAVPPKYSWLFDFSEDMAGMEKNGFFGYINTNGIEVIAPEYQDVGAFKKVALPNNETTPTVSFEMPPVSTLAVSERFYTIEATITSIAPLVDHMIYVNDRIHDNDMAMKGGEIKPINKKNNGSYSIDIATTVTLKEGVNTIYITATNQNGKAKSEIKNIVWEQDIAKPNMYVLSIGISKYQEKQYNINYADKDAHDFSEAFAHQENIPKTKQLYNNVIVKTLTNEEATTINIQKMVTDLKDTVTPNDLFVLHVSAHGEIDADGDFYIRTYDTDKDAQYLPITGLSNKWLSKEIRDFDCTVLQFFDTCHSGKGGEDIVMKGADNSYDVEIAIQELTEALQSKAVYFFASSGKGQKSQERKQWKNGAFTEAILSCLAQKEYETPLGQKIVADANYDGYLNTNELNAYVSKVVKMLTDGQQRPRTTIENAEPINFFILK